MANVYSQLYVHLVFAVKYRQALIHKYWKENLHRWITSLVQIDKHKMLQINSMPDHIHILVGLNPAISISDLVKRIKSESSKWINEQRFSNHKFYWQEGYGAFSCNKRDLTQIIHYIKNQEIHHSKKSFLVEWQQILQELELEAKDAWNFHEPI